MSTPLSVRQLSRSPRDDVPTARIVSLGEDRPATAEDVLRLADGEPKRLCELVDGVLVEKAMGYREGALAMWLGQLIGNWILEHSLGGILNGEGGLVNAFAGNIRIPDVSYVSPERLAAHRGNWSFLRVAPDLAVEILSESNTRAEMDRKRRDYLEAGVRLYWEIDPEARTVTVYRADGTVEVLSGDATLTGEEVLPGFLLDVSKLFAVLERFPDPSLEGGEA